MTYHVELTLLAQLFLLQLLFRSYVALLQLLVPLLLSIASYALLLVYM